SGKELSLSITVFGYVNRNKARYRNAAKPGDVVFTTGTLGDSAGGFFMLTNPGENIDKAFYYRIHRMPSINANFASELEFLPRLALNEISDGLANEASEIAEASQVSLSVYEEHVTVSAHFGQCRDKHQFKRKMYGGEDFELIGTGPKKRCEDIKQIAELTHTHETEIVQVENSADSASDVFLVD